MKKIILSMLALSTIAITSCGDEANKETITENVEVIPTGGTYHVAEGSIVTWNARHYEQEEVAHTGTVGISGGTLVVENENVIGGEFELDMASIVEPGTDTTKPWTLEGHFQMPDFFDVANFSTSKFTISSVVDGVVSGALEVRGLSKDISFPAEIKVTEDVVTATAEFELNLLQFEVPYLIKGDSLPEVEKKEAGSPVVVFQIDISASKAAN